MAKIVTMTLLFLAESAHHALDILFSDSCAIFVSDRSGAAYDFSRVIGYDACWLEEVYAHQNLRSNGRRRSISRIQACVSSLYSRSIRSSGTSRNAPHKPCVTSGWSVVTYRDVYVR